jgi:hypothetical protein
VPEETNTPHGPEYERLIYFATLQDSLLQSYRNILLSSQSILFGIAVFIASGANPLFVFFLLPIALYMIRKWMQIAQSRGFDVWFFHLRLLRAERGTPPKADLFRRFKEWQSRSVDSKASELGADDDGKKLLASSTRTVMERNIPVAFGLLWLVLSGIVLFLRFWSK